MNSFRAIPRPKGDDRYTDEKAFSVNADEIPETDTFVEDKDGNSYRVEKVDSGNSTVYVRGPLDGSDFEPTTAKWEGDA